MSFLRYLDTLTVTDTPCGNFVDDAQRDCQMPNVQSWPELQEYLRRTGWFDSAIQAAQLVWRDYEATISLAPGNGLGAAVTIECRTAFVSDYPP